MNSPQNSVLIIFLKNPKPKKVKTRLGKSIGYASSARIYKKMAETIIKNTKSKSYQQEIFYAPKKEFTSIKKWLGSDQILQPQTGRFLGMKMSKAFKKNFDQGKSKVILIGSDAPLIDKNLIKEALSRLDANDAVIGPSADGGYYLLGLSCYLPSLFIDIDWSTPAVFNQTISALNKAGKSYSILRKHFDIDTEEDLVKLKIWLKDNPSCPNMISLYKEVSNVFKEKT